MKARFLALVLLPSLAPAVVANDDDDARWSMAAMPPGVRAAVQAAVPGARSMRLQGKVEVGLGGFYHFQGTDAEGHEVHVSLTTPSLVCSVSRAIPEADVPANVLELVRLAWPKDRPPADRVCRLTKADEPIQYQFGYASSVNPFNHIDPVVTADERPVLTIHRPVSAIERAPEPKAAAKAETIPDGAGDYPPDVRYALRQAVPDCRVIEATGLTLGIGPNTYRSVFGVDAEGHKFRLSVASDGHSGPNWRCEKAIDQGEVPGRIRQVAREITEAKGWRFARIRRATSDRSPFPTYEFLEGDEVPGVKPLVVLSVINQFEQK